MRDDEDRYAAERVEGCFTDMMNTLIDSTKDPFEALLVLCMMKRTVIHAIKRSGFTIEEALRLVNDANDAAMLIDDDVIDEVAAKILVVSTDGKGIA